MVSAKTGRLAKKDSDGRRTRSDAAKELRQRAKRTRVTPKIPGSIRKSQVGAKKLVSARNFSGWHQKSSIECRTRQVDGKKHRSPAKALRSEKTAAGCTVNLQVGAKLSRMALKIFGRAPHDPG
jgi:hypothetical protein